MGSAFRQAGQAAMYRVNWKKREGVLEVGRCPDRCTPTAEVVMSSAADTGGTHVTLFLEVGPRVLQIEVS